MCESAPAFCFTLPAAFDWLGRCNGGACRPSCYGAPWGASGAVCGAAR